MEELKPVIKNRPSGISGTSAAAGAKPACKGFNISDFLEKSDFADMRLEEKTFLINTDMRAAYGKKNAANDSLIPCLENLSTGELIYIERLPSIIGIADSCDIIIKDDDRGAYISRKHAVIDLVCGHYAIKDMSTNGSFFLNDDGRNPSLTRLPKDSFTELRNRQIVRFAKRNYRFIFSGEER